MANCSRDGKDEEFATVNDPGPARGRSEMTEELREALARRRKKNGEETEDPEKESRLAVRPEGLMSPVREKSGRIPKALSLDERRLTQIHKGQHTTPGRMMAAIRASLTPKQRRLHSSKL